jgi:hypothetical protein
VARLGRRQPNRPIAYSPSTSTKYPPGSYQTITGRTATVAETASGTSITGTLPTDRQTGDYVVAHFSMSCTVAQFTGPGGSWVQIVAPTVNSTSEIVAVYGMFTPGSAPVGTSSAAAGRHTCLMQAWSGVDPTTPIDVAAVLTSGTLPLALTGVATVTAGALLLSGTTGDFNSTFTWTFPASMTPVANQGLNAGRAAALAQETIAVAGATGTRTWTASTLQACVGYTIALRPAPAGGPSTINGTATLAGAGAVTATATQGAGATPTGAGALTATATQNAGASLAGAGSLAATGQVIVPGSATLTGAGTLTAAAAGAVQGTATLAGAGVLTAVVTQIVTATPTGAGAVSATVRQGASASPTGAGALTASVVQQATATLAGAGTLTANAGGSATGTASPTGAGVLTATAVQVVTAAINGAGAVTANAVQQASASPAGAGTLTAAVVQRVTATLTGAGALTASAQGTTAGTATLAGAGAVSATATVTLRAGAALTGAGTVSAAGAIAGTASLTGAGALSANVRQQATAVITGAGTVVATAGFTLTATAVITGAGTVVATGRTKWTFRPNTGTETRPDSGRTTRPVGTPAVTYRP